jgi:hypothetical protein
LRAGFGGKRLYEPKGAQSAPFGFSWDCLSGFVAHGAAYLLGEVCWKFVHAVLFAAMFRALFQNILFSLASSYEVAVHAYISAGDYF